MMTISVSMAITSISKISSISRPLAIVVDTIAIRSMIVRTALVDIRAGTTIVSSISRPLAITMSITTIPITTIMSMQTLGASVSVAGGMTIAISWLSISRPLVNVVTIGVMGRVIAISKAISRLSFSRPLAIAMTISIATIVSSQALD